MVVLVFNYSHTTKCHLKCLTQTFCLVTQDLDEVRIGLLKHLADFLRLLKEGDRREYLPRLNEFLKMDNDRNWRFRQEMAEQMGALVSLYTAEEVKDHLCPIAQFLVRDKVAAVRTSAVEAYTIIIQHLLAESGGKFYT